MAEVPPHQLKAFGEEGKAQVVVRLPQVSGGTQPHFDAPESGFHRILAQAAHRFAGLDGGLPGGQHQPAYRSAVGRFQHAIHHGGRQQRERFPAA